MVSGRVRSIALAVLLSVAAVEAHAAGSSDGKAEFETASKYFQAEEYEAALPYFQKAYELSGRRPATVYGLAQCERALKMYAEAIRHFEEYLATKPPQRQAQIVTETLRLLKELHARQLAEAEEKKKAAQAAEPPPKAQPEGGDAKAIERADTRAQTERDAVKRAPADQTSQPPPAAQSQPVVAPAAIPPRAERESDDDLWSSPVTWLVVGVAAVAGGVALAFALKPGDPELYGGTIDVVLQPQRSR